MCVCVRKTEREGEKERKVFVNLVGCSVWRDIHTIAPQTHCPIVVKMFAPIIVAIIDMMRKRRMSIHHLHVRSTWLREALAPRSAASHRCHYALAAGYMCPET